MTITQIPAGPVLFIALVNGERSEVRDLAAFRAEHADADTILEELLMAGSFENGYDESIATIKGRFWYVGLKKRF